MLRDDIVCASGNRSRPPFGDTACKDRGWKRCVFVSCGIVSPNSPSFVLQELMAFERRKPAVSWQPKAEEVESAISNFNLLNFAAHCLNYIKFVWIDHFDLGFTANKSRDANIISGGFKFYVIGSELSYAIAAFERISRI